VVAQLALASGPLAGALRVRGIKEVEQRQPAQQPPTWAPLIADLPDAQRQRATALLGLYDATNAGTNINATAGEAAARAGMTYEDWGAIEPLLSQMGYGGQRTLGGPAGKVEITAAGVLEAERLLALPQPNLPDEGTAADVDASWYQVATPTAARVVEAHIRILRDALSNDELVLRAEDDKDIEHQLDVIAEELRWERPNAGVIRSGASRIWMVLVDCAVPATYIGTALAIIDAVTT
jgi:hypothetical protein